MKAIQVLSDEKFLKLQKQLYSDITITPDNVNEKIIELPKIYAKYQNLYVGQRRILKNINISIQQTKKRLYHKYKFQSDFSLDNATERMLYVEGDDEMCDLYMLKDKQDVIVDYLKENLVEISKMSYLIRSYVDLEKMRNGVMV